MRVAASHLVPDAAERVVDQELDHIAWREELIANGEFTTVPRRLTFVAHLLALVSAVEELVHPADRFVLAPYAGELARVQDLKKPFEGRALRPEHTRRVTPVEEHLYL